MLMTGLISLLLLIGLSAFFSGAETSMMALNRYRLRHLARQHHKAAQRAQKLLKRPDRLLGVILIGNTFANILASSIATILASRFFGNLGVAITTVLLTCIILLFGEVIPKTLATVNPERFAFPASFILKILLTLFYPIVWILNFLSNNTLKLFGIQVGAKSTEPLSKEELRTLVFDTEGKLKRPHRHMLLGVLDLEKSTVQDILIPRHKIYGINLDEPWESIRTRLIESPYSRVPIFNGEIDNILGILPLKKTILMLLKDPTFNKEKMLKNIEPTYFIPESTTLQTQLINFQKRGEHFGVVVDEYGDIQGVATVEDILEEIVGEYMNKLPSQQTIQKLEQNQYIASGDTTIRDLNRKLETQLPLSGPKTLNGLITEHLQTVPTANTCVMIQSQPLEILEVEDNAIKWVKIALNPTKTPPKNGDTPLG